MKKQDCKTVHGGYAADNAAMREDGRSLSALLREGRIEEELLPFEKFERLGPGALTDAELLAVIIRTGSGKCSPMDIGRRVLEAGGAKERGLSNLYHLSLKELKKIPGIGEVKAVQLKCITELAKRIASQRTRPKLDFKRPELVAEHYMEQLRHEDRERLWLLSLNARMKLISKSEISLGTVMCTAMSPREIYMKALSEGAVNIIIMHNHPGGDPSPSEVDLRNTDLLNRAGRLLDVRLADHLIIGDGRYFSFCEHGLLQL